MANEYKPTGYTSVAPYLVVAGADGTIRFLTAAFGAVELRRFPGPGGSVAHAEVRIDDTVVMLADGSEGWPSLPAHVHLYVPDVDAAFQRALQAGGQSIQAPVQKEDEDRRGGVMDPGGTTWWVSTRVGLPQTS